jgi:hypothetical protein
MIHSFRDAGAGAGVAAATTAPRRAGALRRVGVLRMFTLLLLPLLLNGCMGYGLVRMDEMEMPSYEPRPVVVPTECTGLIERAARQGLAGMTEHESRTVAFCQQQQILRALEDEAAARRLESHAAAARFALQLTTVVIGALVVIIGWAL